jgi:hypothetical protein
MRLKTGLSILLASSLALASTASYAGNGPGRGGADGTMDRGQQMDRDRAFDRAGMQDRDRMGMREQDRDRDRDRIHDPANMRDEDIYGNALMSEGERKQYRKQLGGVGSEQAREQFQMQHERRMQQRALQQGVDLVPPGQGPIYGGELMSVQERNQFREQLRHAQSDEEREALKAQHRERMRHRARALNLDIEGAD